MALGFRDSDALQVVVRSGVCPPEVYARGAKVGGDGHGGIVLAPERALASAQLAQLAQIGVRTDAQLPGDARTVRCWAEAIAPVKVGVAELPSLAVVTCEPATTIVDLAAELVRLGCDRQELLVASDVGIARIVDPPTYTLVRAVDREAGLRGYWPDPPGQDLTWCELGYRHPLADRLRAERSTLLLVGPERWRVVPDAGWLPVDSALELVIPGDRVAHQVAPLPPRRRVPLRLAGGRRGVASLWVIRDDAIAAVDKLLATLPEDVVARLACAATGGPGVEAPTVIIRARSGRSAPPDLSLAGAEAYAPLHQMPDVYAPSGAIVEPPLRHERLRQVLGVRPAEVMWLAPSGGDRFTVERIADSAFTPLLEWAEYVIHASAPALVPWLRAVELDFTPFVSTGLEWGTAVEELDPSEPEDRRKKRQRGSSAAAEPAAPRPAPRVAAAPNQPRPHRPHVDTSAAARPNIDAELAALEVEFVALDAPADAPERLVLLERLGAAYARAKRRREAGLCFARAVWEASGDAAMAKLDAWIAADLGGATAQAPARAATPEALRGAIDGALSRALASPAPATDDVRLVAALTARKVAAVTRDPHRVTRWLDDHDGELDARSLWLARIGLAALAGGDPLGLARARDRILARLAGGLQVERELPGFLRLAGRSGTLGHASGEQLGKALDELLLRLTSTKRKRTPVEAPQHYTNAYASYQIAHGFARVGHHARARALVAEATKALAPAVADPTHGPVHSYLIAAYTVRVDQAIAGLPPETSLGDELDARLAGFDRVNRYKVDRLREASWILSPTERPEAIAAYASNLKDSRGAEFDALRALEPGARAKAVDTLVTAAVAAAPDEKVRLLDGILDVMVELPEADAVPLLARIITAIATAIEARRARLYAEALVAAGHFGRGEMVRDLLDALAAALRSVAPQDLPGVLTPTLRALRRIGLRAEIAELLAQAEANLASAQGFDALRGRLAIASGLAFLGDQRAVPILDQARKALDGPLIPVQRLDLIRDLALAYAQTPLNVALAGIADLATQLAQITDHFGTNTHFCLSVLHVIESLVLGLASDDLALGEAGRRFVEDDEHLIRRRLHADLDQEDPSRSNPGMRVVRETP
jgi:hypothetical protein